MIERHGYAVLPRLHEPQVLEGLRAELAELIASTPEGVRAHGIRNLSSVSPGVSRLAASPEIRSIVHTVLGSDAQLVRSILFDKIPGANWKVAWHQDLTIAVQERLDVEGFGPWTTKRGVTSVQPPASVLESMLTVRVHLDECGHDNGPVRVIPGSHRHGRLKPDQIDDLVATEQPSVCSAELGGVLVMRPLLLHASSPAGAPSHRRVVHLDFAFANLPGGLRWSRVA